MWCPEISGIVVGIFLNCMMVSVATGVPGDRVLGALPLTVADPLGYVGDGNTASEQSGHESMPEAV
jgi:hypothetical protein